MIKRKTEIYTSFNNHFSVKIKDTNWCTFFPILKIQRLSYLAEISALASLFGRNFKQQLSSPLLFPWPYSTKLLSLRRVAFQIWTLKNYNVKSHHSLHWRGQFLLFPPHTLHLTYSMLPHCYEYPSTVRSYRVRASLTFLYDNDWCSKKYSSLTLEYHFLQSSATVLEVQYLDLSGRNTPQGNQ